MEARREAPLGLGLFGVICILLVASGAGFGQETLDPSNANIEILKLHWEKQVRLPRNFDPSVISTGGTFSDPASRTSGNTQASAAVEATRAAPARTAAGSSVFPATPGQLPVFYEYSMKIKNVDSRAIEGLAWDYLFIDPSNHTELGKHQFLSYAKVRTARSATLRAQLRSPPIRLVRAADSAGNKQPKLIERSAIQCVLYADETVWKNPHARAGVCELLKHDKALMKRKRI